MKPLIQAAARADIPGQYRHYLDQDLPDVAGRFMAAVSNTMESLVAMPEIGPPGDMANPRLRGLRSRPVKSFEDVRIDYLASGDTMTVVRVCMESGTSDQFYKATMLPMIPTPITHSAAP